MTVQPAILYIQQGGYVFFESLCKFCFMILVSHFNTINIFFASNPHTHVYENRATTSASAPHEGPHPSFGNQRFNPLELVVTTKGKIARYDCSRKQETSTKTASGNVDLNSEKDGSATCDLPVWTVNLDNPVSQMLSYPMHDAVNLLPQEFTVFEEDDANDNQRQTSVGQDTINENSDNIVQGELVSVSLNRLPSNGGLYAVVNRNDHIKQQQNILKQQLVNHPNYHHNSWFLPYTKRLQVFT